jgi:hypothetical protein
MCAISRLSMFSVDLSSSLLIILEMILFTVSPATAEVTISAMMGSTMYEKSAHGRGLTLLSINQHA